MSMTDVQYIDLKEAVAQILFYGYRDEEWNPESEEDCDRIAERIINLVLQENTDD